LNYNAPVLLFNKHLETIYPSLLRKVKLQPYKRERIVTPDQDFLDLDWLEQKSPSLAIISHGLEGNTDRAYVKGMAKAAYQAGLDVLAWNYRGCSEEINKQLRFYHSGATDDLDYVIHHAIKTNRYEKIYLVGFSLGGNLTLKYLGEATRPAQIKRAVVFSVPIELESSCEKISQPSNWVYSRRFLNSLRDKIIRKHALMPDLDIKHIHSIKTLMEFDDHFTGPIHGFKNAHEYYYKNSAIRFMENITTPTLLVSALNDPFLSPECYPNDQFKQHSYIRIETPSRGGHVGFAQFHKNGVYWSEERAIRFLTS
jgi:uncharacterized protein